MQHTVTISSPTGYGERGAGNVSSPDITLTFDVELIRGSIVKRGLGGKSALYNLQVQYFNNYSN